MAHVTALCITHSPRLPLLQRAAINFLHQDHADKELIVLTPDAGCDSPQWATCQGADYRVVPLPNATPNQLLRHGLNLAAERGGYVALWDDDCQFHPTRLRRQLELAEQFGKPCFLSSGMWFFHEFRELFIYEFEKRHEPLYTRVVPSTLLFDVQLMKSDRFSHNKWPKPDAFTRSATHELGMAIVTWTDAVRPVGEWWLLKHSIWGGNARGYETHRGLVNSYKCRDIEWAKDRRDSIMAELHAYQHETRSLDVCGSDGIAWQADGLNDDFKHFLSLPVSDALKIEENLGA